MIVRTAALVVLCVVLHCDSEAATACVNGTELFHVNCSAPEGTSINGSSVVSDTEGSCSKLTVLRASLDSTIWLCPTELCAGCLYIQRSTEVAGVKAVSKDNDPVRSSAPGEQEEARVGGYLSGLYTLTVNYWKTGVRSTIWLTNLFTPSFSESFIPLPTDDAGDYFTVEGAGQDGDAPFTYAVCILVHSQSPCLPDGGGNVSSTTSPKAPGESPTFSPSTDAGATPSRKNDDDNNTLFSTISGVSTDASTTRRPPNSYEDEGSSKPDGFIAATVSLSVLLILACVILTLLLLHRRTLLAKFQQSADVLSSAFQRSESSEQMVVSSPNQRATRRLNSLISTKKSVSNFQRFRTTSEDAESGFTAASSGVSSSGVSDMFYIDVFGPAEEAPKSPLPGEGSHLQSSVPATYDSLRPSPADVSHCYSQLRRTDSKEGGQIKTNEDEDGHKGPVC